VDEGSELGVGLDLVFVLAGHFLILRLLLLDEALPFGVVSADTVEDVLEEGLVFAFESVRRQRLEVVGSLRLHPLLLLCLTSNSRTSLQEHVYIVNVDVLPLDKDSEAHEHLERQLIDFEEDAVHVSVDLVSQTVDDVLHPVLNSWRLYCVVNTPVEQLEELVQRCVVHPVNVGHFHDAEVEHCATGGNRSILLTLLVNFDSLLCCSLKIFLDFL